MRYTLGARRLLRKVEVTKGSRGARGFSARSECDKVFFHYFVKSTGAKRSGDFSELGLEQLVD